MVTPYMTREFLISQIKSVSAKTKCKTIKGWPNFSTGRIRNSQEAEALVAGEAGSGDRGSNI